MKYNELKVSPAKNKRRVGRGISAGQGKTAGRGTKGQGARTGKKLDAMFQGGQRTLVTAIPKARGFKSKRTPAQIVYSDHLNSLKNKTIDNFSLFEAGLIASPFQSVKVIARGNITEKIILKVQAASQSVKSAIVKAGGEYHKTDAPLKQSAAKAEAADK